MGQKNNLRFAIGAYWLLKPVRPVHEIWGGISLWQITEKQSQGHRILVKVEELTPGHYFGSSRQMKCNELEHNPNWIYTENVDAVRTLYAKT